MFNLYIFLLISSCLVAQELKKDFKRLEKFKPQEIYPLKKAQRIANSNLKIGNYKLQQALAQSNTEENTSLLEAAEKYFKVVAEDNIQFYTNNPEAPVGFLVDPAAMYYRTYTQYLLFTTPQISTIFEVCAFNRSYNAIQEGIRNQQFTINPEWQQNIDNMLVEGFRKTGSHVLLNTLLHTDLLYNNYNLSSLWDGMSAWDNVSFSQSMQTLSENSCDFLDHTTIMTDPIMKLYFYNLCLQKNFNPFSLSEDCNAFESLRDPMLGIMKDYMHSNVLDELSSKIIKDSLNTFKEYSIRHTFNTGNHQQIISMLQGYFKNTDKISKTYKNHQLITPLLRTYLSNFPKYARLMTSLCKNENNIPYGHFLFAYIDLNGQQERQKYGLKHLQEGPSAIGLINAIEQTKLHQNWDNIPAMVPAFISHLKNLSFDDLNAQIDFFYTFSKDHELLDHMDSASFNMLLAHYYTFMVRRGVEEKKELLPQLIDYHQQSSECADKWLDTEQIELIPAAEDSNMFFENGIMLSILGQSPKLLTQYGKQIAHIIAKDARATSNWTHLLITSFKFLEEHKREEFTQYLENSEQFTNNAYSALMNILGFLYCLEQDQTTTEKKVHLIQNFLDELATRSPEELHNLTSDLLYDVVRSTYKKHVHKELLCIMRDHAPEIEEFALQVATYIGKIKTESQENQLSALNFFEDSDIFEKLRQHPDNPSAVLTLAAAIAGKCYLHAGPENMEYRLSQLQNLNELHDYITKLKTFTFEESDCVTEKLNDIEDTYHREKLLWDMEFDHLSALNSVKEMLSANNQDAMILRNRIEYAIKFRQNKATREFNKFFQFCLTHSQSHHEFIHPCAILSSFAVKDAMSHQACIDILEKDFSLLLAESILCNMAPTNPQLGRNFATLIESKLPEWRMKFPEMSEIERLNHIKFLHNLTEKCVSPVCQLAVLEFQNYKNTVTQNDNNALNNRDTLPQADDYLRRLIKQLQTQIQNDLTETPKNYAEYFRHVHNVLDQFMACNYFHESRKYVTKDQTTLYNLLFAQVLLAATQAHYGKILPKSTENESLKHQLTTARKYIDIIKRVEKTSDKKQQAAYDVLVKTMSGLGLSLEFQHNPAECVRDLSTTMDTIFSEFDLLDQKEEMMRKITYCFPYGSLHDCVRYLEEHGQSPKEQMLMSYLSYVIANRTENVDTKNEYIQNIIKVGTCTPFNPFAAQTLFALYEGGAFPEFKDDKRATELLTLMEKYFLEKFSKFYKTSEWGNVYPRLKFAAESGFSIAAIVLAQIYKNNNALDDANIFAVQALKNEKYFQEYQPLTYNRFLHAKAEKLLAEINYKILKSNRRH